MKIKINDLPLRNLFDKLRQEGLVLGIDEYELLLKALIKGFGLEDQAALERLCKTLWVKSSQEEEIFNTYFSKIISQPIYPLVTLEEPVTAKPTVPIKTHPQTELPPSTVQDEQEEPPAKFSEDKSTNLEPPEPTIQSPPEVNREETTELDKPDFPEGRIMEMDDIVELGKAKTSFLLFSDYLPLSERQMKQTWRYLRRPIREGPLVELDVAATIDNISRDRFFLEPVLVPQRRNRVELVVLLDIDGSMVAFHGLGNRIKGTVTRGGQLGSSRVYYFHNCPVDYVYGGEGYSEAVRVEEMLSGLSANRACMLIFSDGGAARGGYSEDRLVLTEQFLRQCRERLRHLVWVNPVPRERWAMTTAGEIERLIPMFECDRLGLQNAVKVLRGNSVSH